MEIGFIFGNYDNSFGGSGTAADRLSRQMQQAWASFARSGNPGCPEIGDWPLFCERQQTLIFSQETHIESC
jgi:para-nitrobenzyl esterase